MRTIKFRGKDIRGWHYGDLRHTEVMNVSYVGIINENDKKESGSTIYIVQEETVGQFTGLYDKNGKEIYEGDILKYTRYNFRSEYLKEDKIEEIYVVFWNESKYGFYCRTKFKNGGGASGFFGFEDERAEKNEIEVVGNIYDNPELLKGGKQ